MRKWTLFLSFLCWCLLGHAQFSVAIVGGPQVNSVKPEFSIHPDTTSFYSATKQVGLNFGFIANAALNKKQSLFFRTGVLYSARGSRVYQEFDTAGVDLTEGEHFLYGTTILKLNYVDIPADLLVKLPMKGKTKFLLGGGVQASLFYNGSTDFSGLKVYREYSDPNVKTSFKQDIEKDLPVGNVVNKFNVYYFSGHLLTGFEFGRVFFTASYSRGLTDFFRSETQSFRHNTLSFHLGIFLGNPKAPVKEVRDADRDGIPDDLDECPALPGMALTKGCPDTDGDGTADKNDQCPDQAGPKENNGCPVPDRDKDGVSDEQDECPDQPGSLDNKGCPIDSDHDGVADELDKCPDVAGLEKYNGCPVPDTDNDGVNDEEDKCPDTAGSKENQGCPVITEEEKKDSTASPVTEVQQQKISFAAKQIKFEYNKTQLSASSHPVLDDVVNILLENPKLNIRIEGHTSGPDSEGNRILSQKRADAVKDYFIKKGIAGERIIARGFGSSRHISKDGDKKENPEDRRVELIVF